MRVVTFGERGHRLTEMALEAVSGEGLEHCAHIDAREPSADPPEADLYLSAAYTRIIPTDVLARARTALNVHPSLLPAYVGSHPVYWAMYEKQTVSGVTIHEMTLPVDSGPIVAQQAVPIDPNDDPAAVYDGLVMVAKILLTETLRELRDSGCLASRPQEGEVIYRGRPHKELVRLAFDWNLPAHELVRRSGIFPNWTHFYDQGERIFVVRANLDGRTTAEAGTVLERRRLDWRIAASGGEVLKVRLRDPKTVPFIGVLRHAKRLARHTRA